MKDFTLAAYERYVLAIQAHNQPILRFDEFMAMPEQPAKFGLLRHDVDRRPSFALAMAQLEHRLGVKATYYFRTKPGTFLPDLIKEIAGLGHEIGYHYETMADANGDKETALALFRENLAALREHVPIKTISMHGRPLKPYDNRELWRDPKYYPLLKNEFDLLGEVYLDIDYTDIAYINDTGRNWLSDRANLRDKVQSKVAADFLSQEALLAYLQNHPHPRLVFQIHPERWTDHLGRWYFQATFDWMANTAKRVVRMF